MISPFVTAGILVIIAAPLVVLTLRARRKAEINRLRAKLYLLRFPRERGEGGDPLSAVKVSEQLFANVLNLNEDIAFEVAVPQVGELIRFYASIPSRVGDTFVNQMHALWKSVIIEEADDYTVFHEGSAVEGGYVKLTETYAVPIHTFEELGKDTFGAILGSLSEVDEIGEGGGVQVILRKPPKSVLKHLRLALENARKGRPLGAPQKALWEEILHAVTHGAPQEKLPQETEVNAELVSLIEHKVAKPLCFVNIRLIASAGSESAAETLFRNLAAGFGQFGSQNRNGFHVVQARREKQFSREFAFREFDASQALVLNTAELASVFHMPTAFTDTPRVEEVRSRQLPPPANMPSEGALLGETLYRGEQRKVYLPDEDMRRHLYVIGQTGTGKSTFLMNLIADSIRRGKGVAVLDPHGDLAEHVAGLVPRERQDDVIYVDPGALGRPIGLNMLEYNRERPEEKTFIVNELVNIFDKLYDLKTTGGPMFEQYMRNALLLLMEAPGDGGGAATLMEVPRLFSDAAFRERKLSQIQNPTVIDFWEKEAAKAGGEAALHNITPYITSKFNNFIANDYMRVIIGQPRSSFTMRRVLDGRRILIVNLAKGKIGELNANLLGMIIVGKLLFAALSRVDTPESERSDFNVFIDEFQSFTTDSIASILSEARKYHLSLIVAHQFIAQLGDKIRDAVFGNVGSLMSFRVGVEDAEVLAKQFESLLAVEDIVNIDNFNAYAKLLLRGQVTAPFNMRTFGAPVTDAAWAEQLIEQSKEKYGTPREEVEQGILERLRK